MSAGAAERAFRREYGAHRAAEGRAMDASSLLLLPYVTEGPLAKQWAVRARSYDAFVSRVLTPFARDAARRLRILDLGAGNGWLAARAARAGHLALALDVRDDDVDGLGAAAPFVDERTSFARVAASFEALPVPDHAFDVVVFNAALHYATNLGATLREAARVTAPGGRIVVVDSPFYARESDGRAMVEEKHRTAPSRFGTRAGALLSLPFIEFLTADRLSEASASLGIAWHRHRVRYPLWYELRPLVARLRGARAPSRFDVWEGSLA